MGIIDFQRALADMTLDFQLAAAVRARGARALDGYDLTQREGLRLVAVARQPGMALNCTLARANRFAAIHDIFPMTCVLLEPELKGLLDELWSVHRPDNYQLSGEEAAFAKFVQDRIALGKLRQVEYLEEIFRYEKACWELAMELRYREAASPYEVLQVVRFNHDPGPLFEALGRYEAPPAGIPAGSYQVCVRVVGGELKVEWDRASR
jgi:hypothetical protein